MIADEGDQGAREGAALWKHAFAAIEKSARAKEFLRPVHETFACEIVSPTSVPESIKRYEVVCLFEVKKPAASLWDRLQAYVNGGGRLIVIPGGTEMDREQFNKNGEEVKLLPGTLEKLVDAPAEAKGGVFLQPVSGRHPFTKPFIEWNRAGQFEFNAPGRSTSFRRYWEVKPIEGRGLPIINFADKEQRPFLLENEVGSGGKVMMFATPFDDRKLENKLESWNNLLNMELGHGMVIFDQACWYLGGKSSLTSDVNFICGKPVQAPLLGGFTDKQYVLKGPPGLTLSETKIPPTEGRLLTVPQATHPGNYRVEGESGTVVAGFSVNIDSGEFNLAQRAGDGYRGITWGRRCVGPGNRASLAGCRERWPRPSNRAVAVADDGCAADTCGRKCAGQQVLQARGENGGRNDGCANADARVGPNHDGSEQLERRSQSRISAARSASKGLCSRCGLRKNAMFSLYDIHQPPDPRDIDNHLIPMRQREIIGRHDAGSCQQDRAVRKRVIAA